MEIFRRLFGICQTKPPQNPDCFRIEGGKLIVSLKKAVELKEKGGAIRIESKEPSVRALVLHGEDGAFYAVENKCSHGGRRLDPKHGTGELECCSIGKSRFSYTGELKGGGAKENIKPLKLERTEEELIVTLE